MPIDANGNRAEMIMDGQSTIKRMNPGRFHEHYLNGAARDVAEKIRTMFGLPAKMTPEQASKVTPINVFDESIINKAFDYLLGFYGVVSPKMAELIGGYDATDRRRHLARVISKGIYLWIPPKNPKPITEVIRHVRDYFPQTHGPVTYRGSSGRMVTTRHNIFVANLYIMLLEKTGENWAAVASARLQHFGIPAKLTNEDKHSASGRLQPVRTMGESEIRTFLSTIGSDATADLADQSNNPVVHKEVVRSKLIAPHPCMIESAVNRNENPVGDGRPLVYYRHNTECGGIRIVRRKAA